MDTSKLTPWDPTYLDLKEDEYLLKLSGGWGDETKGYPATGFLCKLTMKQVLHASFKRWGRDSQIYLHRETFSEGWKFHWVRCGKSQEWAQLIHPLGFILEIHLDNFVNLILKKTMVRGLIKGSYMWEYGKLVEKP